MKPLIILIIALGVVIGWFGYTIDAQREAIERQYSELYADYLSLVQQSQTIRDQQALIEDYKGETEEFKGEISRLNSVIEELRSENQQLDRFGYIEFASEAELNQWLKNNQISEREYIQSKYDCDDFAFDLFLDGLKDGYMFGLFWDRKHISNFTLIGDLVYRINPQTDQIRFYGHLD